ncbi:hypothetical protein QOZ80_4AG0306350 [Eleusine coracana subsp. coracana]|nr:hypothetical protein QOZ80_4AG0306350 [Eleusine coracana subsp. coracana]
MPSAGGCGVSTANGHGSVKGPDHYEEECSDLEPFFFDEAEVVADHERRVRREQEEAQLRVLAAKAHKDVEDAIWDYDPKQGGLHYNRLHHHDFTVFDLNEESPLEPMRYTDKRGKDHCQFINSEDESLILTGPKRGLLLLDDAYIEVDLKIKGHEGQEDKELSKGILSIRGIASRVLDNCEVESESLASRLSTVEVVYAVVKDAVEATIEIEVLQGEFYGMITACTTSISNCIMLHDSKLDGVMTCNGKKVVQLLRRVVAIVLARGNIEAQYVEMKVPLYSYGCEKKIKKVLSNLKGVE